MWKPIVTVALLATPLLPSVAGALPVAAPTVEPPVLVPLPPPVPVTALPAPVAAPPVALPSAPVPVPWVTPATGSTPAHGGGAPATALAPAAAPTGSGSAVVGTGLAAAPGPATEEAVRRRTAREERRRRVLTRLVDRLAPCVASLPAVERRVVALRTGRAGSGRGPQSPERIARRLAVSRDRVVRIERRAVRRLRTLARSGCEARAAAISAAEGGASSAGAGGGGTGGTGAAGAGAGAATGAVAGEQAERSPAATERRVLGVVPLPPARIIVLPLLIAGALFALLGARLLIQRRQLRTPDLP
jgi:hypothetical protein